MNTMDPFTDIFAFISNNDTNFFKDGNMESKKQSLSKNNQAFPYGLFWKVVTIDHWEIF